MERRLQRLDAIEGALLIISAPFLLFPTVSLFGLCLALLSMVAVWIIRWVAYGTPMPVTPYNGALLVWALAVATGTLVTAFPMVTLPKATGLLLGLAVWRYLALVVRRSHHVQWALIGFLILGAGMIAMGIATTHWPSKVPWLDWVGSFRSVLGGLPGAPDEGTSANQLAGSLLPYWTFAISYGVAVLAGREATIGKQGLLASRGFAAALCLAGTGLIGFLLLITQSRSAWIGALAGVGMVLTLWLFLLPSSAFRTGLGLVLGLGLVVCIAGLIWMGPDGLRRLLDEPGLSASLGGLGTVDFRIEVWRWAWAGVQDFMFTGCGLGTFREVGRLLYPLNIAPGYDFAHAHNIFLQVALDTGVPGLIAYLGILGIAVGTVRSVVGANPTMVPAVLGLLPGLIALHVYGLADALAPGSKPGLIFWYLLGLLTALYRLREERSGAEHDSVGA